MRDFRGIAFIFGLIAIVTASRANEVGGSTEVTTATTMERLSIKLPAFVSGIRSIQRPLDELGRERCDQQAIANLGAALEKEGYRREAATALITFSNLCNGNSRSVRTAINILFKLSDYESAAAAASKLIEMEPYNDNGHFLRASANDKAGLPKKAIEDYITAIELFGDKSRISSVSYYNLAQTYEKLGQFCDAILPIEAWVAIDVGRHDTSQTRAMIASYSSRGNCSAATTTGEAIFPVSRQNAVVTVPVLMNGERGNFILDTGATYVSIKAGFAQKANVSMDRDSFVRLHTANGIGEGKLGRAKTIQLRSLQAKEVPIIIQADDKAAFGNGIDGLLGMSFLSRFKVTIDAKSVKLSPRSSQ